MKIILIIVPALIVILFINNHKQNSCIDEIWFCTTWLVYDDVNYKRVEWDWTYMKDKSYCNFKQASSWDKWCDYICK